MPTEGTYRRDMKKIALTLIIITLISKITGFGRELALSYFYGATAISDAYIVATSLPNVLLEFVGVAISTSYIPMLSKVIELHGEKEGNNYTFNIITAVLAFMLIVFIVFQLFLPNIISVLAMGFDEDTARLTVSFGHIILFSLFAIGPVFILSGFLQVKGKFAIASMIGFPLNTIIIISIFLAARHDPIIMMIRTVVATYAQMAFLLFHIYRGKPECRYIIKWNDGYIKETLLISVPVILGASVHQINVLIDKTIASTIVSGGVSALNYANRLQYFIQSLFVMSLLSVLFPAISAMAQKNKKEAAGLLIQEGLSWINFFLIPSTFGILIFSQQIVELLFGRGAFDYQAVLLTSSALFFYSIGMLSFGYREIFAKVMYSMHDTKTPTYNAVIGVLLNIVLNIILSKIMGLPGLALATSLSTIVTSIGMWHNVQGKIGRFKIVTRNVAKIFLASLGMALMAKTAYNVTLKIGNNQALMTAICVGILGYFGLATLIRIEETVTAKRWLISRIAKNSNRLLRKRK